MDDAKELVKAFFEPVLKMAVKNSKDEEKKEEIQNEDVDKRKLIDEIGGILKDKVDDEIIRLVIKKCEEIGYDESEAGTADNKKAKNEEDVEDEEKFEEEKEIANKKSKNEEDEEEEIEEKAEDKEVENKCKNSMGDIRKAILGGQPVEIETNYLPKSKRLELGNQY